MRVCVARVSPRYPPPLTQTSPLPYPGYLPDIPHPLTPGGYLRDISLLLHRVPPRHPPPPYLPDISLLLSRVPHRHPHPLTQGTSLPPYPGYLPDISLLLPSVSPRHPPPHYIGHLGMIPLVDVKHAHKALAVRGDSTRPDEHSQRCINTAMH